MGTSVSKKKNSKVATLSGVVPCELAVEKKEKLQHENEQVDQQEPQESRQQECAPNIPYQSYQPTTYSSQVLQENAAPAPDKPHEDAQRYPALDMSGPDGLQHQNNALNANPSGIKSSHLDSCVQHEPASVPGVYHKEEQHSGKDIKASKVLADQAPTAPSSPMAQSKAGSNSKRGAWKGIWKIGGESRADESDEDEEVTYLFFTQSVDTYQKMEDPSVRPTRSSRGSHNMDLEAVEKLKGTESSQPSIGSFDPKKATQRGDPRLSPRPMPDSKTSQQNTSSAHWGELRIWSPKESTQAMSGSDSQNADHRGPASQHSSDQLIEGTGTTVESKEWTADQKDSIQRDAVGLALISQLGEKHSDLPHFGSPTSQWVGPARVMDLEAAEKEGTAGSQPASRSASRQDVKSPFSWTLDGNDRIHSPQGRESPEFTILDLTKQGRSKPVRAPWRENHGSGPTLTDTSNENHLNRDRVPNFSSDLDTDDVAPTFPDGHRFTFAGPNSSSIGATGMLNSQKDQPISDSSMQRPAFNNYARDANPKAQMFSSAPSAGPFASNQWSSQRPQVGGSMQYRTLDLTGQRVLIIDATEAIGRNCAFRFAELACDLILLGPDNSELQKLGRELDRKECREASNARPLKVELVKIDIDIREIHRIHALAMSLGPVDILINNAGMCFLALEDKMKTGSSLNKKEHDMVSLMYSSITSPIAFTWAFGYYMRERGSGHIVNVENSSTEEMDPNSAVHCSAADGLGRFTTGSRHDLVGTAVRVSSISPGYTCSRKFGHGVGNNDCMPLLPEDIADDIIYTCTRPSHVHITTYRTNEACNAKFATSYMNQNGIGAIAMVGP